MDQERLQKLTTLPTLGIHPYPENYLGKISSIQVLEEAKKGMRSIQEIKEGAKANIRLAGRMMTYRSHGKISFAQLQDLDGRIQICFMQGSTFVKDLDEEKMPSHKFWEKMLDLGDYIGVEGELFETQHGEITLLVTELTFLGKALRPMPEKFHGLANEDTILRQRYLDTLTNEDSRKRFRMRSNVIKSIREFFWENEFLEVETPTLEHGATGAAAKPYFTHNNALDIDLVLRISQELPLKKIVLGGFERVFEIGKAFRNEGIDPSHLPEHTHFEWYAAYWSFKENMDYVERLIKHVIQKNGIEPIVPIKDKEGNIQMVDFGRSEWERIDYVDMIKKDSGINIMEVRDVETLRIKIKEQKIDIPDMENMMYPTLVDYLYKKVSRPKIVGPAFLYNYPKSLQPLARVSDANPDMVDQFQLVVNGWEIVKGYSELVDPVDQANRFKEQEGALEVGDEEAMQGDDEYIVAMEYGMPPISGVGLGLDRFITLLSQQDNLRDCIFFPLMRPKGKQKEVQETKVAVAILNKELKLELWQEMNTIGHLTAAFAAREGKDLFMQDTVITSDNQAIKLNIQHAIMIKESSSSKNIKYLVHTAKQAGLEVAEFTREMIETSDDKKVASMTKSKLFDEIEHLGVLVFGKKSLVDKFTASFPLYSGNNEPKVQAPKQESKTISAEPTRENALALIHKYHEDGGIQHAIMTGISMKALAKYFGENEETWELVGLLHDIDWDIAKKAGEQKHLAERYKGILAEINLPESLIEDILSHDESQGFEADSLIRKAIRACDELSGFIGAVAKVRPDKMTGIEASSVVKKMKDKGFAAAVNRDHLKYCESLLNIPVSDFLKILLPELEAQRSEFGL